MKDIMKKLSELEATAPTVSKKKMLNEDSTTPPMNAETKPSRLKDIFETMASNKPIPVVGKQGDTQQTGAGFLNVTDNSPAAQALGNALSDLASQKKVQIVMPTQPGQAKPGQPAPAGSTGQPQAGQMQMKEKWDAETKVAPSEKGKYAGKDKAELTKAYNKLKASGPHKKGSPEFGKMRELAFAIRAKSGWGKVQESQLSETRLHPDLEKFFADFPRAKDAIRGALYDYQYASDAVDYISKFALPKMSNVAFSKIRPHLIDYFKRIGLNEEQQIDEKLTKSMSAGDIISDFEKSKDPKFKGKSKEERKKMALGAYYGMHPEKSKKKKTDEADIPSTQGIDNNSPLSGSARSMTTLEGKKPDFLDLDKDGNKKESMKKAAADKKKQKVKESMNHRISAARLEGKSHGLRGHAHCGKSYEDLEEMKAYHEGYKEGLDECYGMGVYEDAMPATVGGMADQVLDELSPQTLQSYQNKNHLRRKDSQIGGSPEAARTIANRTTGWARSQDKLHGGANVPAMEDDMEEGNAFTAALAKTPKGGKFSVGGKTFTDRSSHDAKIDEYAFEAWDRELSNLLNEGTEVTEGLSVSVSKGQQNSPDSVTITAQDAEADQLLQLVKHAGLGLFGDEHAEPSSAMSIQPAHGAADEVGAGGVDIDVVDGSDGMLSLMKKLSGVEQSGSADYADEKGHKDCGCEGECDCNEETCNECGSMMEAGHNCGSREMVDEVESEEQQEFKVAEDNAPDSETAEHNADEEAEAEEDAALAKAAQQNKTTTVNEGGDGGEASEEGPESKEGETDEEGETVSESFSEMLARLDRLAEGSGDKPKHPEHDEKDDKDYDDEEDEESEELDEGKWNYPKHMTKNVTTSDMGTTNAARNREERKEFRKKEKAKAHAALMKGEPKKEKDEELNEWANQVGKGPGKGSDAQFTQDIDFMTKVIAGGLNKPKSTGQTTIPVIAGQEDRMHDSPADWATLAGIKK